VHPPQVGCGTRETAEDALAKTGRPVQVAMEPPSNGAIERAVARGLGVAIFSPYAVSVKLRLGVVVELPVTRFPLRRQWHLVYPRDRRFGPVWEAFLSFLGEGRWRDAVGEDLTTD
jgi:DNA-binding transcriptional LysR family regulator